MKKELKIKQDEILVLSVEGYNDSIEISYYDALEVILNKKLREINEKKWENDHMAKQCQGAMKSPNFVGSGLSGLR
jgi:hypothetical protein